MLKVTLHRDATPARIVLEGRLAGAWVNEVRTVWRTLAAEARGPVTVELTDISYIDQEGKALLAELWREGAEFRASGCCTKFLVEEITKGVRAPA